MESVAYLKKGALSILSRGLGLLLGQAECLRSSGDLAHSDPTNGFLAFSGTSSAAPAIAGLAAVLISALKDKNIPIDAKTIVKSIQLSAKKIGNHPYISQGYGLPNAARALEIYQQLIEGKALFLNKFVVAEEYSRGGLEANGILLKRSEFNNSKKQFLVYLYGEFSKLVPESIRLNKVFTGRVKSTSIAVQTVDNFWYEGGRSRIALTVDAELIDWESSDEHFISVEFFEQNTGIKIGEMPITLINDRPFNKPLFLNKIIDVEGGERIHLFPENGVVGMKVSIPLYYEEDSRLILSLYNPNGKIQKKIWLENYSNNEILLPFKTEGHHQLTVSRSKGARTQTNIKINLIPVKLKLASSYITMKDDKASLKVQQGKIKLHGKVKLFEEKKVIMKGKPEFKKDVGFLLTYPVEKGSYKVRLKKENESSYSFFKSKCLQTNSSSDTKYLETITFDEQNVFPLIVNVVCRPFDFFDARGEDLYDEFFYEVIKSTDEPSVSSDVSFFNVPLGTKKIEFDRSKLKSNSKYNVYFYLPSHLVKSN